MKTKSITKANKNFNFNFTVLGSSSAAPTKYRNPSAFLVSHNKKKFLIDCGEGTQMQFLRYDLKFQNIDHIFISHLHGDHFFGLMGLISTMHLLGRAKPLNIYAPPGLDEIITAQLKLSRSELRYLVNFIPLDTQNQQLIFENANLDIYSFPLKHGIECCGFLFKEKPKSRKIIKEKLPHYATLEQISQLLDGKDILDENGDILYKNDEYTLPPFHSKSFAYCSDTAVFKKEKEYIKDVDVVYHETTFLDELEDRSILTHHSTARQVGKLAKESGIKQLIIGHFSARYKNLSTFITEVQENFDNVHLAEEGKTFEI